MTPYRPRRVARAALAVLAATALVAACGDDDDTTTDDAADEAAPAASIEVTGAWARTSPAVADAGAVYFEIANTGDADDALVGVSVDPTVAGKAELHETAAAADDNGMDGGADDDGMDDGADDDGMGDDGGMGGGMMEMRPVDRIDVPAGDTVALEPGGYHVMLLELAAPLQPGDTVEVTLSFEESGEQVVTADVRDTAP